MSAPKRYYVSVETRLQQIAEAGGMIGVRVDAKRETAASYDAAQTCAIAGDRIPHSHSMVPGGFEVTS